METAEAPDRVSAESAPMIAGELSDPLLLVLFGAGLVVVGLIHGWLERTVHARRTRGSR